LKQRADARVPARPLPDRAGTQNFTLPVPSRSRAAIALAKSRWSLRDQTHTRRVGIANRKTRRVGTAHQPASKENL